MAGRLPNRLSDEIKKENKIRGFSFQSRVVFPGYVCESQLTNSQFMTTGKHFGHVKTNADTGHDIFKLHFTFPKILKFTKHKNIPDQSLLDEFAGVNPTMRSVCLHNHRQPLLTSIVLNGWLP